MTSLRDGARAVVSRLREQGHAAYWVGGCVRDLEMGREPHDYDVATGARPDEVAGLFERAVMVGAEYGVVMVPLGPHHYEVATFRTEGSYLDGRHPSRVEFAGVEADVRRRDFTINGLLYDPAAEQTIDYVGGRDDIAARLIRTIGPPDGRFAEDRLRMLRAVRLAAELDFEIERQTFDAIRAQAAGISTVSAERIRDELLRLLGAPARARGVRLLERSALLEAVLPEVGAMRGVEQPPEFHPEGDVFTHTVLALEHLRGPSPVLALAALLHDVGKPPTMVRADRIRFNNHDEVGARMAEEICRRLRCSGDETERVTSLVRGHLRVKDLPKMREAKATRFLLREDADDHLELHRADCLASHGDLSVWEWARERKRALLSAGPPPPRLVTGDDLIALGYRPGPAFATILEAVEDAQLEGTVRTRDEALALVRNSFPAEGTIRDQGPSLP